MIIIIIIIPFENFIKHFRIINIIDPRSFIVVIIKSIIDFIT